MMDFVLHTVCSFFLFLGGMHTVFSGQANKKKEAAWVVSRVHNNRVEESV